MPLMQNADQHKASKQTFSHRAKYLSHEGFVQPLPPRHGSATSLLELLEVHPPLKTCSKV